MDGYIAYIRTASDELPVPEPERPAVVQVINEPGSTEEVLTAADGEKWERQGRTVFATAEEAEADAWRRIREAEEMKEKGTGA